MGILFFLKKCPLSVGVVLVVTACMPAKAVLAQTAKLVHVVAAVTAGNSIALAAATPVFSASLKPVVIIGSRSERFTADLPMGIDMLDSQAIEAGQIRDIRDAVKNLPNISVRRSPARFGLASGNSGRDGNAGFNIRGLDGNRVLLLTDGVRAPRSYVFGSNAFGRDYFAMDLLKRIEIMRGPASALYGSDGLAGLVNFIAHEPADFLKAPEGKSKTIGGRALAGYSSDNNGFHSSATVAGRLSNSAQWLATASLARSKALENRGTNGALNADRTQPNPQTDNDRALLARLVLRPTADQKHTISLEHVEKKSEYDLLTSRSKPPILATSVLRSDALSSAERTRLGWNARFAIQDSSLADTVQTVASYQKAHSRQYIIDDRSSAPDRTRDTTYNEKSLQWGVQADKKMELSDDWAQKITYGFDYVRTDVNNWVTGLVPPAGESFPLKRFPDTREISSAVYAQSEISSERWRITPGVRLDRFSLNAAQTGFLASAASLSGSAVSPKIGVLFNVTPEWRIFGNYASGFRAPSASQLNGFFENIGSFYKTVSNPHLKPEKSRSFEIGARGNAGPVTLEAAAFTSRFNNLITDNFQVGGTGQPENPTVFQSVNIGKARISGFEIKGSVDAGPFAGGQLKLPFAYGQARGTDSSTGQPLNSIDPSKLHIGVRYESTQWQIGLDINRHAAKKTGDINSASLVSLPAQQFATPAATTMDVSGQWRLSKSARVNAALVNLTNKKYWAWADVRGVAANSPVIDAYSHPGRTLNVSLVVDF